MTGELAREQRRINSITDLTMMKQCLCQNPNDIVMNIIIISMLDKAIQVLVDFGEEVEVSKAEHSTH